MNIYKVEFTIHKHTWYEDPRCPISWMGSGVYDIEVEYEQEGEAYVFAESEEKAASIVESYDFESYPRVGMSVDEVEVHDVEFDEVDADDNEPHIFEIDVFDEERV